MVKKKKGILLSLFVLSLFFLPCAAKAGEVTDIVKADIDRTLSALKDPALQGPENRELRSERVRGTVEELFDFEEVSKRSLGRYWRARTEAERHEFVRLFTALLENSYMDRIYEHRDDKVLYTGEVSRGGKVEVRTKVITTKGTEVPISYRLMNKDGAWKAYDMVVEGVSLLSTYRTQFDEKIQSSSYEALVEHLREKVRKKAMAP